jgi:hypothetical protein
MDQLFESYIPVPRSMMPFIRVSVKTKLGIIPLIRHYFALIQHVSKSYLKNQTNGQA